MVDKKFKDYFWNKYNSCYKLPSKKGGKYFLMYDESYVRKMRIATILGCETEIENPKNGEIVFDVDYSNGFLFCSYSDIWDFYFKNYSSEYYEVEYLLREIIKENKEVSQLLPQILYI